VRVIAGEYGGRRLTAPRGRGTRPTSDRVREAWFMSLEPFAGLVVVDLFAGSGALGIEALSRGATYAFFIDNDAASVAAIERNVGSLDVRFGTARAEALWWLGSNLAESGSRFGLVFIDPPYSSAPRLGERLSQLLPGVLAADARIVTESDKRTPLDLTLPLEFERDYGDTRIRIHRA